MLQRSMLRRIYTPTIVPFLNYEGTVSSRRQLRRLTTLTTMQNALAGMNPSWPVLVPMTHMMTLLMVATIHPSQHRRPTRMVEAMVSTHDR
jgi:hypothetical protein